MLKFAEFEASLAVADDPAKADAIRMLSKILGTVKSGRVPDYTIAGGFESFNIDVDWILDQYKTIFAGLYRTKTDT